jgi:hypothetical protein
LAVGEFDYFQKVVELGSDDWKWVLIADYRETAVHFL